MSFPEDDDFTRDPLRVPRAFARAAVAGVILWAIIVWLVTGIAGCLIAGSGRG